jgi:hypothetical protein
MRTPFLISSDERDRLDFHPGIRPSWARDARTLSQNAETASLPAPNTRGAGKDDDTAMAHNLDKYHPYLDGFDLTDDQKTAMIEALWSIAEAVSDLAWGINATQLIQGTNDNDSSCDSNVVKFFALAASDPVLDDFADALQRLEADNDNDPTTTRKRGSA